MHRKTLATGILLLFIGSILSPVVFGVTLEESEDTTYLDDLFYIYSPIGKTKKKTVDYNRVSQRYQAVNKLTTYIQEPPANTLDGPIDSAWPMASHDNHHTGLSTYNTSSNPGHEIWRFLSEWAVDTGIAIDVDGTLYFGDFGGELYAVNPDGSLKWKDEALGLITLSTPCIAEDGTIVIGGHTGLVAYNSDGSRKWKIGIGGSCGGSPTIGDDGTIYIGHHNSDMVAVYPNGTIRWKYDTGDRVVSDPAIADDGTILFGSADDYVYALNPNGTLKWRYLTQSDVKGSPSIDDNGIIYIASWGGYLHALYPNGTMKWKTDIDQGSETTPCFGPDGTIYVSYKKFWAINPSDGSVKWTFDYMENNERSFLSNPAISADGIIYIGTEISETNGGQIYAINPDGSLRWRKFIANTNTASSPAINSEGTVYIGSWWHSYTDSYGCVHAFNERTGPNNPPNTPTLFGEPTVKPDERYHLDVVTTDPDNDPVSYYVDWGDGSNHETIEIYSGIPEHLYHWFEEKGTYIIRAKATDAMGLESDWGTLEVEVPYTYQYPVWHWLSVRFPLMARILNLLGGFSNEWP